MSLWKKIFGGGSEATPAEPLQATHTEHYDRVKRSAPGGPCRLTLVQADTEGPYVSLAYQWHDALTDDEADKLDTRVRAYITCAIYDAAVAAGLSCQPGPPHGQRPSWLLGSRKGPTSLAQAGFDTTKKVCWLSVGPGMMILGGGLSDDGVASKLARAFQRHFAEINA